MNISFIKSDGKSFAENSRVYEVYFNDNIKQFKIAIVVGYLKAIKKYYITLLGDTLLYDYYHIGYENIENTDYITILNEFFKILPMMNPEDVLSPAFKDYYDLQSFILPPLTKKNFTLYISDIEPYYYEDLDEYDGIYSATDDHSNYLLDNNIVTPIILENYDTDEYEDYNFNELMDYYYDNDSLGVYCVINYNLLNEYAL